jgi:hypothetical protein
VITIWMKPASCSIEASRIVSGCFAPERSHPLVRDDWERVAGVVVR